MPIFGHGVRYFGRYGLGRRGFRGYGFYPRFGRRGFGRRGFRRYY
ncbi:hypothetical protein WAK64_16785 [Bacillus spongiae]|uniref:Spore coat protein n=1 Tax=Bacillus spongiae TaxID=2683610 RepID=A0ABU8HH44_9BACI